MPAWLWHAAAIAAQQACYAATCRVVMKGACIYGRPAASTIIHTPASTRIHNPGTRIHNPGTRIHNPGTRSHNASTRIHNPPLENTAFIVYNIFRYAGSGPQK